MYDYTHRGVSILGVWLWLGGTTVSGLDVGLLHLFSRAHFGDWLAMLTRSRLMRGLGPVSVRLRGFGAMGFLRDAKGVPQAFVTVGHALQGAIMASRGMKQVLYANVLDARLAKKYPCQYIHKSFFEGGTDLGILVTPRLSKLPKAQLLKLLAAETRAHCDDLTRLRRP